MKTFKRLFILLPLVALSSCGGYSLEYLVKGDMYLSAVFARNYYDHWDNELKNAKDGTSTVVSDDERILLYEDLWKIDPNFAESTMSVTDYGIDYCLMKYDESFKYGVQSKLFDGIVTCGGQQQKVRVQIRNTGFSVRFQKESDELTYFALRFKAAVDYTHPGYQEIGDQGHHNSTVTEMVVTIYTKDQLNIVKNEYKVHNIVFDHNMTNVESYQAYKFLAFKTPNLSRAVGVSITYTYDDPYITEDWDYSLLLYELFLPYTYWH